MHSDVVAIIGFVSLFMLMLLRVPVGIAMGLVGVTGFGYMVGDWWPALKLLAQSPMRTATSAEFAVIPLFLLMGAFASSSGMSRELFRAGRSPPIPTCEPPSEAACTVTSSRSSGSYRCSC